MVLGAVWHRRITHADRVPRRDRERVRGAVHEPVDRRGRGPRVERDRRERQRALEVRRDDVGLDGCAAVAVGRLPREFHLSVVRRRDRRERGEGNRRGERRDRMHRQQHRRARRLVEVEVGGQVAEDPLVLANVGARVGAAVGLGIDATTAEEIVFDELGVRVEAQGLMIDVAALGVGADHDAGHAQAVAVLVDDRGHDVVVETAPVVPRQEDRGRVPIRAVASPR